MFTGGALGGLCGCGENWVVLRVIFLIGAGYGVGEWAGEC